MLTEGMCGAQMEKGANIDHCRPDPEKMIAHAKKKRDAVSNAIQKLLSIAVSRDVHIPDPTKAIYTFLGHLMVQEHALDEDINRWMSEIDKT